IFRIRKLQKHRPAFASGWFRFYDDDARPAEADRRHGTLEAVGGAMGNLGITFFPTFWGLMAAIAETIGGFLLIIGLAFRPACLLLAFTMFTAALNHLARGDGLMGASQPIELFAVFIGLLFIGPGKYSVDKK